MTDHLPALPLFDQDDRAEVRDAADELMKAAQRLVDLRKQVKPQRPWRPSDNLTPEEIADIERD